MAKSILPIHELYQLRNLEFIARQVVEGFIIGLHKSPYHGFSVEFAEHRLYNPGESTKDIDWKVYARTDKMFVKQFEEETNLRCQLVLDTSSSMYFPKEEKNILKTKIGFAAIAAAGLMELLKRQRDAFGVTLFANEIEEHTRAKSTTVHHRLLLSYLEKVLEKQPKHKATQAAENLHKIAESVKRRSLIMIFSDMLDDPAHADELFNALQHLKLNKHEVILFYVIDKQKELDFEFENRPYIFEDVETGEKVKLQYNQVKEHYKKQIAQYKQALKLRCGQYKIDFVEADIQKGFEQILLPYFLKRKKMY